MDYEIKKINMEDKNYPDRLKIIENPPKNLYIIGEVELLNTRSIAIIGSRVCSEKGSKTAKKFAYDLSNLGFTIISGMAKGIDTSAHIGTLNAGGKTIAVLGGGFNHIFPRENIKLFEKIIETGGAVITEYQEDTRVSSEHFIERNRIVSGLSQGVLVVEAKYRSGTSITANFAKRQNKKIFCIAHDLNDKTGEGTNRLIKQGAFLVTDIKDITKHFDLPKTIKINNAKIIRKIPKEYEGVYECIKCGITDTNDIIKKLKIDIKELNYILTMLEIENYIAKDKGKFHIKEDKDVL